MQTAREDRNRSAVGVISGVCNKLVVECQCSPVIELIGVIGLEDLLGAVVEPAIADQKAGAAGGEEIAVRSGKPVDGAANADRVVRPAPIAALDREAAGQAAVDVGEGQDFILA